MREFAIRQTRPTRCWRGYCARGGRTSGPPSLHWRRWSTEGRLLRQFGARRRNAGQRSGRPPVIWFFDVGGDQSFTNSLFPSQLASATNGVGLFASRSFRSFFVEGCPLHSLNTPSRCSFFFRTRSACSTLLSRTKTCIRQNSLFFIRKLAASFSKRCSVRRWQFRA